MELDQQLRLCTVSFSAEGEGAVVEIQELEVLGLDVGVELVGSECVLESLHPAGLGVSLAEGANDLFPVLFDAAKALFAEQMVGLADEHRVAVAVVEAVEADLALIFEELLRLPEREN